MGTELFFVQPDRKRALHLGCAYWLCTYQDAGHDFDEWSPEDPEAWFAPDEVQRAAARAERVGGLPGKDRPRSPEYLAAVLTWLEDRPAALVNDHWVHSGPSGPTGRRGLSYGPIFLHGEHAWIAAPGWSVYSARPGGLGHHVPLVPGMPEGSS